MRRMRSGDETSVHLASEEGCHEQRPSNLRQLVATKILQYQVERVRNTPSNKIAGFHFCSLIGLRSTEIHTSDMTVTCHMMSYNVT